MVQDKGGTVLIIEDDAGVARLQQRRLERVGYQVVSAGTAEEGVEKLKAGNVDLVLLDYRLPGNLTGLDVYARLKETGQDVPVILVTGFSDEIMVIQALRVGVRDFVTKSVEYLDYLPEAVARVLKQVRTEQQLAQSQARLAGIISSARDAIITIDSDQRVNLFNAAAERMFRCTVREAIGQPVQRFLPGTADGSISLFGQSAEKDHLCAHWFELVGLKSDGEDFPLGASLSATAVARGKICGVIVRDITERRQAEEQIREQAAMLDQATDAILVRDMQDRIRFWNRGAERLYGWTAAEAEGTDANQLLFKGSTPELDEARRRVVEKGEWSGELRQVTKEGKEVIVASRWTLVREADGRPKSQLVINTDLTEKKRLEAQFLRTQRLESLGTLASGIAHDLNNVLTPIMMAVYLLEGVVPKEARETLLVPLQASAEHGAEMVKQILSFSKGGEGQRNQLLQVKHLIKDIEKMLRHTLPKSIDLRIAVPTDLWPISADATRINQVLMNLCVNARDAMPCGGRLTVSAENVSLDENYASMHPEARPGAFVILKVADTGTGIPADILDRMFDPFFTTKEQGKGTGLGLSTVLGIVKAHGGFISIDTKAGQGTQFSVHFPAMAPVQVGQAQRVNRPLPVGNGELVLVVDDETSIRAMTKATLETHGYRVLTAGDGSAAVALYAQHRGEIRVVLTDMMMPIMNGPLTIRALRSMDPEVPIIAVSGLMPNGQEADVVGLGVRVFLRKPYTAQQLLTTLAEVLDPRAKSDGEVAVAAGNGTQDTSRGAALVSCTIPDG